MIKSLILLVFFNASIEDRSIDYINDYKDIAILEMQRTGIPASIKLAQGILETSSGSSTLALESKNHFGIKCKSYWKGSTYYHKDDDKNDKGQLIKSCFRAYDTPLDSYVDHSNFIVNSVSYSTLLNSRKIDYKFWARGLQYYGYASDPAYANKLISIIERYELYQFDK